MAPLYLAERNRLRSGKYVQKLLQYLPKNSSVLDLGCGAGVPVDDILLKAGCSVTGIDISDKQIELARKHCPKASYLVADINDLKSGDYSVRAIVCFYTLFHTPRMKHEELIKVMASFLPRGGMLLISMGDRAFEGEHKLFGEIMWSSQWGTAKNKEMVVDAGFRVIIDEIDASGGERHQVIMGQKI